MKHLFCGALTLGALVAAHAATFGFDAEKTAFDDFGFGTSGTKP